jgi:hypothetical protein
LIEQLVNAMVSVWRELGLPLAEGAFGPRPARADKGRERLLSTI